MIQMMTAYTTEVDEIADAIAEILGQIDLGALKKNTVGIVTCHFDFTDTGFIEELHRKLPFDIVGMTTMASANPHGFSMFALSLTVLTSDDVVFETALTAPLDADNYRESIAAAYAEACGKMPGDPAMIIGLFPYHQNLGGATLLRTFDDICKGIPIWGSLATNIDVSYKRCLAFRNNIMVKDTLAMITMHGPVNPEFVVVSIPKVKIRENRAIITESDGCILKEVNGMPVLQYLESFGVVLMKNASTVVPFMVYYEGASEPVALGVYVINDDGSLLCGGEMTKGAAISFGEISVEGILDTTREGVERLLHSGKKSGALMLPCVTRYVMLSPAQDREMGLVAQMMKEHGTLPFMLGYAGGEICPVRDESGKLHNRFHNYTFSACIFD